MDPKSQAPIQPPNVTGGEATHPRQEWQSLSSLGSYLFTGLPSWRDSQQKQ